MCDTSTHTGACSHINHHHVSVAHPPLIPPSLLTADFELDCRRACLKMNASLWYATWNPYGQANYVGTEASRCRCSDPTSPMPSQLVDDPGYQTWSLAGPHAGLRPFHDLDGFDLELDECIRHCETVVPNSTWVALWNPLGELEGGLESGGVFEQSKRTSSNPSP